MNRRKGENDRRKYFMNNLYERMLPTSVWVEHGTSWFPVGRSIRATEAGFFLLLLRGQGRPWSRTGLIFPWLHSTVEIRKICFPLHGEVQNVWQNETCSGVVFYENFGHRLIPDYSANSKDPDQLVEIVWSGTLLCATVPNDSFSGQWRSWPFHYQKLSIQIYRKFHLQKLKIFR